MPPELDAALTAAARGSGPPGPIVQAFGRALAVDRCFLYLRDPATLRAAVAASWRRDGAVPDLPPEYLAGPRLEDTAIHTADPMFAAALAGEAAAFIADTEAPDSGVNPEVERKYNHRALVHLNLNGDGTLWGILEPMTVAPRAWSLGDRELCLATRHRLTPIARAMVRAGLPDRPAVRLVG